jgi:hypothetical protein
MPAVRQKVLGVVSFISTEPDRTGSLRMGLDHRQCRDSFGMAVRPR